MHVPLKKLAVAAGLAAAMLAGMSTPPVQAARENAPGQNMSRQVAAQSPLMSLSDTKDAVMVQDTTAIWGGPEWSLSYLWSDSYL